MDLPVLTSGRNLGNSTFACTLQWYVQICHEPLLFFSIGKCRFEMACNALNIAGNPIKDVNAQLSFLSSGSQVVEWTPNSDIWWKSWKFPFFACTLQWYMQICPWTFTIFCYWKCRFEMAVMHLILQETP